MNLGETIRKERLRHGLNLTQMVRLTAMSKAQLSRIETGSRLPTRDSLERICKALELNYDGLANLAYVRENDPLKRLMQKVRYEGDCWIFTGNINRWGYGIYWYDGKMRAAHRVSFLLHNGYVPNDLELDHTCNRNSCINPSHLEPVTPKENARRLHDRLIKERTEVMRRKGVI